LSKVSAAAEDLKTAVDAIRTVENGPIKRDVIAMFYSALRVLARFEVVNATFDFTDPETDERYSIGDAALNAIQLHGLMVSDKGRKPNLVSYGSLQAILATGVPMDGIDQPGSDGDLEVRRCTQCRNRFHTPVGSAHTLCAHHR
jgi:hypothetical protein